MRYPRDYDTVPRHLFWLFHLLWLFPWSVYLPSLFRLSYKPLDRAGKTRLLALCWTGFILVFFTFSTTQEYYSMPCYPALALLLGSALAAGGAWIRRGTVVLSVISGIAALVCITILVLVRGLPTPGDISSALTEHPDAYTLSLGHMEDLTISSFAYLRLPLALAAIAFSIGCLGTLRASRRHRGYLSCVAHNGHQSPGALVSAALMMVLFFHAARLAMVVFDPYLSSRTLAESLLHAPGGELVVDHHYYDYSSVFFYTNRRAWLLNGRFNNLVYGSYAPGAPDVFLTDASFRERWLSAQRYYYIVDRAGLQRMVKLIDPVTFYVVKYSGGKYLMSNQTGPGFVPLQLSHRFTPRRNSSFLDFNLLRSVSATKQGRLLLPQTQVEESASISTDITDHLVRAEVPDHLLSHGTRQRKSNLIGEGAMGCAFDD
jgi:hypothetical protein